jgi:hypothetical protein
LCGLATAGASVECPISAKADGADVPSAAHRRHAETGAVQKAHRRAALGIELRHSGQFRVVDATSGSVFLRAINLLTGRTTRKNNTAATMRKDAIASMTAP